MKVNEGEHIDSRITALHEKAKSMLLEKSDDEVIITALVKEGIDEGYAAIIIDNVKSDLSDKKNFWIELSKGIGITTLGLIFNYISYTSFAKSGSLTWVLYWGIVVFGITIIFRAFIIFRK